MILKFNSNSMMTHKDIYYMSVHQVHESLVANGESKMIKQNVMFEPFNSIYNG